MSTVVETVTDIVTPILVAQKFELVEVEFVKEGKNWFLRVFIDKEGGIDIEECAFVSEQLSEQLERPLKKEADYQRAVGEYIHVSLYQPIDGEKQFEGFLQSFDENQLVMKTRIKTREKERTIDRKNIAKARLAIQF